MMDARFADTTRVEVISGREGRILSRIGVQNVRVLVQDEGKTLKLYFDMMDDTDREHAEDEYITSMSADIQYIFEMIQKESVLVKNRNNDKL